MWNQNNGPWRGFCVAVPHNKADHLYIRTPIGTCPNNPNRELHWGDVAALGFYGTVVLFLLETIRGEHKVFGYDLRDQTDPVFFDPRKVLLLSSLRYANGDSPEKAAAKMKQHLETAQRWSDFTAADIIWQQPPTGGLHEIQNTTPQMKTIVMWTLHAWGQNVTPDDYDGLPFQLTEHPCHFLVAAYVEHVAQTLGITPYSALDRVLEASKIKGLSRGQLGSKALPEPFPAHLLPHVEYLAQGRCFFRPLAKDVKHDVAPQACEEPPAVLAKMPAFGDCGLYSLLRVAEPQVFGKVAANPTPMQCTIAFSLRRAAGAATPLGMYMEDLDHLQMMAAARVLGIGCTIRHFDGSAWRTVLRPVNDDVTPHACVQLVGRHFDPTGDSVVAMGPLDYWNWWKLREKADKPTKKRKRS